LPPLSRGLERTREIGSCRAIGAKRHHIGNTVTGVRGKVAFVTGGVSGIGFGLSRNLLAAGARVAASYRRREKLDEALHSLTAAERQKFYGVQTELTDRNSIREAAKEIETSLGNIHILCNNAGMNMFVTAHEATADDWESIMAVNFRAVTDALEIFLPRIRAHGEGGHVLNTGSMACFIAVPHAAPYTAAKFALRGLTEALYWNLRPYGIGVSLLCPGLVRTNIVETMLAHSRGRTHDDSRLDERTKQLRQANEAGMDPMVVGAEAVRGIERNALYILTHPEFRDELEEIHQGVIKSLPDGPVPAARLEFERARRRLKEQV
jgi:NAD(P)-dependent dehydrogenase (short-subunit alcohol dehydrogenase family)